MNNTSPSYNVATFSSEVSSKLASSWASLTTRYPPGLLELLLILAVQILCFWIPAALLLLLDLTFPKFSNRHKIQSERRQPTWSQIKHCIQHVAVNTINGTVVHLGISYYFGFEKSMFRVDRELPGVKEVVVDFVFAAVLREIMFYYVHRALHDQRIYKFIHKQHHTFTAPMAFAAQYAHPLEHLGANITPIVLPLILKNGHLVTFLLWLGYSLIETSATHSGYDFFQPPLKAEMHDLHHEKFNVNYGGVWILDYLHGTDKLGWNKAAKDE